MTSPKDPVRCKDCVAVAFSSGPPDTASETWKHKWRPAPHPGPRCATHHREKRKADKARSHELAVQRTYGLKQGEYEKLYVAQNGRCGICERATGATRKLSVDHDHDTGEVRGLLCRPCNNMLGHARDDYRMFSRAVRYLVCPPARAVLAT